MTRFYKELLQLYDRTEDIQPPTFDANEMLANILATDKKEVVVEKPQAKVVGFPNWAKLAVAAALVGLVALFFFPFNDREGIATGAHEEHKIILADGSTIVLNNNSHLVYDEKNWQEKREVKLTGIADFEVKKGLPFTVMTDMGTVEVLGTVFTVVAKKDNFGVICREGRVAVSSTDGSVYEELSAEETINIRSTFLLITKKDLTKFKNVDLGYILGRIESKFGVTLEIENEDLTQRRLTGSFQYEDLEKALKTTIGTMSDVSYEIQGEKVIVKAIEN